MRIFIHKASDFAIIATYWDANWGVDTTDLKRQTGFLVYVRET